MTRHFSTVAFAPILKAGFVAVLPAVYDFVGGIADEAGLRPSDPRLVPDGGPQCPGAAAAVSGHIGIPLPRRLVAAAGEAGAARSGLRR
ncbi:hypothetical protein QN239_31925 [Mycolicibacterium sp. Y3]